MICINEFNDKLLFTRKKQKGIRNPDAFNLPLLTLSKASLQSAIFSNL